MIFRYAKKEFVIEPASDNAEIPATTPNLLDDFLAQEGVLVQLRQRISNLEQFRELYLLQQESLEKESLEKKSLEKASQKTPAHNNLQQDTSQNNEKLEEQAKTIATLERQVQELNGCQAILESELDRLANENELLKNNETLPADTAQSNNADLNAAPLERDDDSEAMITKLQQEVDQAMEMAFGAMRSNADLGGVINLLTRSFECATTAELGKLVLETIGNYDLKGVVCFKYSGKQELFGTITPVSDEDKALMQTIPQDSLITECDSHFMLHTHYCDFLIREFDTSDFKAFNDLKDTLRMLATGVNASTRRIISELAAQKERTNLERLVVTTKKNLKGIDAKQQKEVTEVASLTTALISNIKNQLNRLQGDTEKKNQIVSTLSQELVKIEKIVREASFIDSNFKKVIDALTSSLTKPKI